MSYEMDYENQIVKLLKRLPHKLKVQYAFNCALDCKHLMKDVKSLKVLEVADLWLKNKTTHENVNQVCVALYSNNINLDLDHAYHAAYSLGSSIINNDYGSSNSAYWTARALNVNIEIYYHKLNRFMNNLTSTEKMIYNINKESNV